MASTARIPEMRVNDTSYYETCMKPMNIMILIFLTGFIVVTIQSSSLVNDKIYVDPGLKEAEAGINQQKLEINQYSLQELIFASGPETPIIPETIQIKHFQQAYRNLSLLPGSDLYLFLNDTRVIGSKHHAIVRKWIVERMQSAGLSVKLDVFRAQIPQLPLDSNYALQDVTVNQKTYSYQEILNRVDDDELLRQIAIDHVLTDESSKSLFGNENSTSYPWHTFTNIIGTFEAAKAKQKMVLAAHYDSKWFPSTAQEFPFYGATDSAAPCAILLNIASVIVPRLSAATNRTVQFIFFDGEEALETWRKGDCVYGARHLAMNYNSFMKEMDGLNHNLNEIEVLVLLDLWGSKDMRHVPSFFKATHAYFSALSQIEHRLFSNALWLPDDIEESGNEEDTISLSSELVPYFDSKWIIHQPDPKKVIVDDDHVPFLERNVPCLHLIPVPFPNVWHKKSDDKSAMNWPTNVNAAAALRLFVAQYLGILQE